MSTLVTVHRDHEIHRTDDPDRYPYLVTIGGQERDFPLLIDAKTNIDIALNPRPGTW